MTAPQGGESADTGTASDAEDGAAVHGASDHNPARPLRDRLAAQRERVAALVRERSADDPTADDPLRGLYLSKDAVQHLLEKSGPEREDPAQRVVVAGRAPLGPADRLAGLAARMGLTDLETTTLLLALAPDLDRDFEQLYGYLNNDVSRRRATVGLVLDVCGLPALDATARDLFHPTAPLSWFGLLRVEEPDAPFLGRTLRVPDRLAAHLIGNDTPDAALEGHVRALRASPAGAGDPLTDKLAKPLAQPDPPVIYLRERREGDGLACAAAALTAAGRPALHLTTAAETRSRETGEQRDSGDERSGGTHAHSHSPLPQLLLEARLRGCAIVVYPLPEQPADLIRSLDTGDVPMILIGAAPYDPQWCDPDPLVLDAPGSTSDRVGLWAAALGVESAQDLGFDLAGTVATYRLDGDRIRRAAHSALDLAALDDTDVTAEHLRLAARQQSASGLERHARRIMPAVGWHDLVLPKAPLEHLHELAQRARHRERVLGDWQLSAGGGRGRGVLAMFAGESGTGKTLSAEVIAADLGLDLYVVQLSSVVDKYVGETEKNLERIFSEADRTDAVLLFDEADAVFGKRSDVKDAHDRYANLESAYLLQRLESFSGIAVLTTNLRANIDDAFTRRLDLVVDFPFPDEDQRLALWRHSLAHVPCADDIDPALCARDFELAGGSIRSAVVTAAYAAATRGGSVTSDDLLAGAQREYRKAGRLVVGDTGW
ncbi:ATP-binding protein [Streptomyces sp. NBC_01020]|uniref:ATP-binding protein n=1 Tax=unclassified Streptomyces TaxID=2593676 RepID=UPI0032539C99|nr:ATP-binding protein [Streptomyces sp. NBC_01020]WSX42270.1 ATP-binding protein [Streptomyces sp. NBC_00963]WSX69677.1 ATP-binding protein [Streptomyces sp. NBC_00932]